MKQVFDHHAYDVMSAENGILVVEKIDDAENKVIRYKYVAAANMRNIRPITKTTFLSAKFMDNYEFFAEHIDNYLIDKIAWLGTSLITVSPVSGKAKLIDKRGNLIWHGDLKYNNENPFDIAVHNNDLWASYPKNNILVRYNTKTMRDELRIGGDTNDVFNKPGSIYIDENGHMLLCNIGSSKIIDIDLKTFSVKDYLTFDQTLKKYLRVGSMEFVLLSSGVYEL